MLYYTVPSIVNEVTGCHYGWHLQIKLSFYTKQIAKPQNQDTIRTNDKKTTKPRQIIDQRIRAIQLVAVKREENVAAHGLFL